MSSIGENVVRSNLNLDRLLGITECGYFPQVLSYIQKDPSFNDFRWYFHFKRATDPSLDWDKLVDFKPHIVIILGDESNYLPIDIPPYVKAVFKSYLNVTSADDRIFSMPVGPNPNISGEIMQSIADRENNVFFSGNLHTGRKELYRFFSGINFLPFSIHHRLRRFLGTEFHDFFKPSYIRFTARFQSGLQFEAYNDLLNNSKIVLCPQGNPGIETMRHYEAIRAGCVVISKKFHEANYLYDAPFVYLNNWKELKDVVEELITDENKLLSVAEKSRKWWLSRASPEAVSRYIFQVIRDS